MYGGMAGPGFDVFVVGAADSSTAGQARLAASLASHLGLPPAAVAKGLAERRLRAANNVDQAAAQALVRDLKGLGATTVVRPATPPTSTSQQAFAAAAPAAAYDPIGPPPSSGGAPGGIDARFGPPPSAPGLMVGTGAPPRGTAPPPPAARPAAAPAAAPAVTAQAFHASEIEDAPLELDTSKTNGEGFRKSPITIAGAGGIQTAAKLFNTSSASGLAVDAEAAGDPNRVRCPKHGLIYDTRKASGCSKCLAPARQVAARIATQAQGVKIADFGEDATRRALIGMGVALVVGLIPAAYHALRMGARDIHRLRDEQELLSRKPATDETLARFDAIESDVKRTKSRAMRNTGLVWLVVAGGTLVGWYRLT
jgi:hypothetical protein